MYRKPEGGEERTGLCESTPIAVFQQRSWDFREGHVRLFSYEATERCGRGACSDKVSEKKQRTISNSAPFFFLIQQPEDNKRRYWESAPHQRRHGFSYSL